MRLREGEVVRRGLTGDRSCSLRLPSLNGHGQSVRRERDWLENTWVVKNRKTGRLTIFDDLVEGRRIPKSTEEKKRIPKNSEDGAKNRW